MSHYSFEDLQTLMSRLRDPEDGCPWDLKQTWKTIPAYTLEEVYEVVDAIEKEDWDHVREELGDLLFQVVFYGQFAKEQNLFSVDDVVDGIVTKLIRRHPHVFPDGTLESRRDPNQAVSEEQIAANWDAIKAEEKADKPQQTASLFDDLPKTFPALQLAEKIQKKAKKKSFDWPDIQGVFAKIHEELEELKQACEQNNELNIAEELGDVLFSVVNLSRHLNVDSETALRQTNRKFMQRFDQMQLLAQQQSEGFSSLSLEQKEELWQQAKRQLKSNQSSS